MLNQSINQPNDHLGYLENLSNLEKESKLSKGNGLRPRIEGKEA